MPPKLNMTPEEFAEHTRELGRARAKKNYEKNKAKINEKRKEDRDYLADLKKQEEQRQKEEKAKEDTTVLVPKKKSVRADGKRFKIMQKVPTYSLAQSQAALKQMGEAAYKQYASKVNRIFELTGCPKLAECLKKFDTIKEEIQSGKQKNGKGYELNSEKMFFQTILVMIDNFPGLKEQIPATTIKKYKDLFEVYKVKSKITTEETNKTKTIPSWDKYLRAVIKVFGDEGKEFLIASIYSCVPVRDDLFLEIKQKNERLDNKQNYLIVPSRGQVYVIINTYKTEKKYGAGHKYLLTADISKMVKAYMKKHNLTYGNTLFKEVKLSAFVSDMNKKLGIESIKEKLGVKVFRQMSVSAGIPDDASPEEMVDLANRMLHGVRSQEVYRLQVEDDDD